MITVNPAGIPAEIKAIQRYTVWRGVRNLDSGTRTRQFCGFFIPPRQISVYGLEGTEIPEYRPPSITVLNLQAPLFLGSLLIQKLDRNPAMLANFALYPASVCSEVRV